MDPERINIEPTRHTPWILVEPGRIVVMGRSIIENPSSFYEPRLKGASAFIREQSGSASISLGFEYINSGSIKWLFIFLRELSEKSAFDENTSITWYYEKGDDDMAELGFILRSLVECHFTIVEVDELSSLVSSGFMAQQT